MDFVREGLGLETPSACKWAHSRRTLARVMTDWWAWPKCVCNIGVFPTCRTPSSTLPISPGSDLCCRRWVRTWSTRRRGRPGRSWGTTQPLCWSSRLGLPRAGRCSWTVTCSNLQARTFFSPDEHVRFYCFSSSASHASLWCDQVVPVLLSPCIPLLLGPFCAGPWDRQGSIWNELQLERPGVYGRQLCVCLSRALTLAPATVCTHVPYDPMVPRTPKLSKNRHVTLTTTLMKDGSRNDPTVRYTCLLKTFFNLVSELLQWKCHTCLQPQQNFLPLLSL